MIIYSLSTWKKCQKLTKKCTFWQFFSSMKFWKSSSTLVLCSFFLEESVHNYARRETKNCSNDLSVNVLERQGLGASFELYTGTISRVITSLSLIKIITFPFFFSEKSSHTLLILWFFSKQLSTNGLIEPSIIVQMIWIVVRWKKEILAHLLSYIVDSQVSWALL